MSKITSYKNKKGLKGTIEVPGDKSISHRSLIFSSIAIGTSRISGILESEDVINTAKALKQVGARIHKEKNDYYVEGVSLGGLREPDNILDLGNSGTSTRLLMGLFSPYNFNTFLTGDDSLRKRPMARVMEPLLKMGAKFETRSGNKLPIMLKGTNDLRPISYQMNVPSAQVKSAIMLAGIHINGTTEIIETENTRDHTEKMLAYFDGNIKIIDTLDQSSILVSGNKTLFAKDLVIPGDPSSAAFFTVAAIIVPNSRIIIKNVCINPRRIGMYEALKQMGANINFLNKKIVCLEEVADIEVSSSDLAAIEVDPKIVPSMIDEFPIFSIAAAFARGNTFCSNLSELTVKESNRLVAIYEGLQSCGIKVKMEKDTLEICGNNGCDISSAGNIIKTNMDHRIAMSFLIMGLRCREGVTVDDTSMISTSFPNFLELMDQVSKDS